MKQLNAPDNKDLQIVRNSGGSARDLTWLLPEN